jgi:hypothetical protein
MTDDEFDAATLPLAAAFPFPMAPAWLRLLRQSVRHFSAEHFTTAVNRAVLTHEHPSHPPIATLVRYADEAANGVEMTADQAVSLIWQAIRKHRGYDVECHRKAYADLGPKIGAAMDAAGGYQRFCDCTSDDKGTLVAQFRQAWDAQVRRDEQQRRLPAALVPRVNGPTHQPRIETPATPRLVAQGGNS